MINYDIIKLGQSKLTDSPLKQVYMPRTISTASLKSSLFSIVLYNLLLLTQYVFGKMIRVTLLQLNLQSYH
jgi:hypothetical protein